MVANWLVLVLFIHFVVISLLQPHLWHLGAQKEDKPSKEGRGEKCIYSSKNLEHKTVNVTNIRMVEAMS